MSDRQPTDDKLRDLERHERDRAASAGGGKMQPIDSRSPAYLVVCAKIEENVCEREERTGPRTFSCGWCHDTGFELEDIECSLGYTSTFSRPCRRCTEAPFDSVSSEHAAQLRAVPWVIDGDFGRMRLRYRKDGKPTLWIYPTGERCEYDGSFYRQLARVDRSLYDELYQEAKRMKRTAPAELMRGSR